MTDECIHGLEGTECAICFPPAPPAAPAVVARTRATTARVPGTRLRDARAVEVKPLPSLSALRERRVYASVPVDDLAAVIAAGAVTAGETGIRFSLLPQSAPSAVVLGTALGPVADRSDDEAIARVLRAIRDADAAEDADAAPEAELVQYDDLALGDVAVVGVANEKVKAVVRQAFAGVRTAPRIVVYPPWFQPVGA